MDVFSSRLVFTLDDAMTLLDRAAVAAANAVSTVSDAPQREAAAARFLEYANSLVRQGPAAMALVARGLVGPSPVRVSVAARLLSAVDGVDASRHLVAALLRADGPFVDSWHIGRLGRAQPVAGVLPAPSAVRPFERADLARALFRHPNEGARVWLDQLLREGVESTVLEAAIDGIASWGEPALLMRIIEASPLRCPPDWPAAGKDRARQATDATFRALAPDDVRPHAAFRLALSGDARGALHLQAFAESSNGMCAALACLRLAWLAAPAGIKPLVRALKGRAPVPLGLALEASDVYAAGALGPALVALVERHARRAVSTEADTALALLAAMTGRALVGGPNDLGTATAGEALTAVGRARSLMRLRAAMPSIDDCHRWRAGRRLRADELVDDLSHPDDGPRLAAAYNLQAITGNDLGLSPGDDVIANLPAIVALRERIRREVLFEPGTWVIAGQPVPAPQP